MPKPLTPLMSAAGSDRRALPPMTETIDGGSRGTGESAERSSRSIATIANEEVSQWKTRKRNSGVVRVAEMAWRQGA